MYIILPYPTNSVKYKRPDPGVKPFYISTLIFDGAAFCAEEAQEIIVIYLISDLCGR